VEIGLGNEKSQVSFLDKEYFFFFFSSPLALKEQIKKNDSTPDPFECSG
jgi:hypothetical protein